MPQSAELKRSGRGCGDPCNGEAAEARQARGNELIQRRCPQHGPSVLEKEGRKAQRRHPPCETQRDRHQQEQGTGGAAALGIHHVKLLAEYREFLACDPLRIGLVSRHRSILFWAERALPFSVMEDASIPAPPHRMEQEIYYT
jgi:hypothetical protein